MFCFHKKGQHPIAWMHGRSILEPAGKGLLISMLKKTQLVLFYQSNNTGAINVKMNGSVLEEN